MQKPSKGNPRLALKGALAGDTYVGEALERKVWETKLSMMGRKKGRVGMGCCSQTRILFGQQWSRSSQAEKPLD